MKNFDKRPNRRQTILRRCQDRGKAVDNGLSTCTERRHVVCTDVHALRTLRNHGVMNTTLQIVFKSVAVAKLVYAASAWYGFCTAADRDRLEAVIRRGKR